MSKIASVCLFLALIFSSRIFSQEIGSQLGYDVEAKLRNQAIESEIAWNSAKKLTKSGVSTDGLPVPREYEATIDELTKGKVYKLDYWNFKIASLVDDQNMILRCGKNHVWLEGFPTKDLLSDQSVRLIDHVLALGTKTVSSSKGDLTIRVIRMLDAEEMEARNSAMLKEQEEKLAATKKKEMRVWTDSTGKYTFHARFLQYKARIVYLESDVGEERRVPMDKLSKDDQSWVRAKLAAAREEKKDSGNQGSYGGGE